MVRDLPCDLLALAAHVGQRDECSPAREGIEVVVGVALRLARLPHLLLLPELVHLADERVERPALVECSRPQGLAALRVTAAGEALLRAIVDNRNALAHENVENRVAVQRLVLLSVQKARVVVVVAGRGNESAGAGPARQGPRT